MSIGQKSCGLECAERENFVMRVIFSSMDYGALLVISG